MARRDNPRARRRGSRGRGHALAHLLQREDAGVESVVQIGGQVGDLVGQIDQLGLKGRELIEKVLGQFGVRCGRVVVGVLDDSFAHGQGQVQAAKARVALLKPGDDAQGVQVVVEAEPEAAQALVESLFAGVAKGRMADVVGQRKRLGQFHIQPQRPGHGARDLGDLKGMREAAAKVVRRGIGGQAGEDLGLAGQAAKGPRMQDAGAVTGKRRAIRMRRLSVRAADEFAVSADSNRRGQRVARPGVRY